MLKRSILLSSGVWIGQQLLEGALGLSPAIAQVTPDRTLGQEASIVQNRFGIQQIGGGATRGTALFHSFSIFNIGTGDRTYFDSPEGIATIFSRVTGKGISTIDGTLGVSGKADLFLMNPNGVVFGKNARLDLTGSFTATTADRILFGAGQRFTADGTLAMPLLAVNVPIGLQWGSQGGQIVSQGSNLQVLPGQMLRLLGSGVRLEGGSIRAGRVAIASVSQNETLMIQPKGDATTRLMTGQTQFAPIDIQKGASIDVSGDIGENVSGNASGFIALLGSRVSIRDGSSLFANVLGNKRELGSEEIRIAGTEKIEILGDRLQNKLTVIASDTLKNAIGNSANILITTPNLILRDGARIQTRTYGTGNAGSITIRSANIEASGGLVDVPMANGKTEDIATGIVSRGEEGASGKGGDVRLESDRITLTQGAEFRASTRGSGNAGDFTVLAKEVTLVGGSSEFLTGFSTSTGNGIDPTIAGRGGNLSLTSDRLAILSGASVRSGTSGRGDAGSLTLNVRELRVSGLDPTDGTQSSLSTSTNSVTLANGQRVQASGRSGNLSINASNVQVLDGGSIRSSTTGSGNAGNLTIRSQLLEVGGTARFVGTGRDILRRSLVSNSTSGSGNAGIMSLTSDRIIVRDGAQVSTATRGSGNNGTMLIKARTVDLTGAAPDERYPTGLFVSVEPTASGSGGSLRLSADRLTITDGSAISADTFGSGRASDVVLNVRDSILIRGMGSLGLIPSRIGSSSRQALTIAGPEGTPTGSGGNLSVKTGILTIDQGGVLTAATVGVGNAGSIAVVADRIALKSGGQILVGSNGRGNAGNIKLQTNQLDLARSASIRAETAQGNGGNVTIDSRDRVLLNTKSNITTNAGSTANGGNIAIKTTIIVQSTNSSITANAIKGQGGNITLEAHGILSSQDSRISAASELGIRGKVTQTTPITDDRSATAITEPAPIAPDQILANSCFSQRNEKQGRFVVTGNGGLPENPTESMVASIETAPVVAIESSAIAKLKAVDKQQVDKQQVEQQQVDKQSLKNTSRPEQLPEEPLPLEEATELVKNPDGSLMLAVGKPTIQPRESIACSRSVAPIIR